MSGRTPMSFDVHRAAAVLLALEDGERRPLEWISSQIGVLRSECFFLLEAMKRRWMVSQKWGHSAIGDDPDTWFRHAGCRTPEDIKAALVRLRVARDVMEA